MEPLTVPGTFDSLGPIRDYVRVAAEEARLDADTVYGLTLAVDELATNSITHGYQEHEMQGPLKVSIEVTDKEFVVRLEDKAPAFDPCKLAVPSEEDLAKPLSERPIGGLGVYLTVKSLDRFDYKRDGDTNCVIMAVNKTS